MDIISEPVFVNRKGQDTSPGDTVIGSLRLLFRTGKLRLNKISNKDVINASLYLKATCSITEENAKVSLVNNIDRVSMAVPFFLESISEKEEEREYSPPTRRII